MKYFGFLLFSRLGNGVPMVTKLDLGNILLRSFNVTSKVKCCCCCCCCCCCFVVVVLLLFCLFLYFLFCFCFVLFCFCVCFCFCFFCFFVYIFHFVALCFLFFPFLRTQRTQHKSVRTRSSSKDCYMSLNLIYFIIQK